LYHLNQSETVSLTFRQKVNDTLRYVTAFIVRPRNDERHIMVAVTNMDAQIRREQSAIAENRDFAEIAKALAGRYEVIYQVNLDTGEYQEFNASERYARLNIGSKGEHFFEDCQQNMKSDIYPEDYPMMALAMQKDHLLSSMNETGKCFLNYRLMLDGRPQYVTLFAVRPKEDSTHILVAVANVDAAKRMEMDFDAAVGTAINAAKTRDELTGVKNKQAYAQTESDLNKQITEKKNPPFAVVVCDVNGLKYINDTEGLPAGDAYLQDACHIVCDTFKHSPVFRIGGDEFAILLKGSDYEHRKQLMQQLTIISLEHSQCGKVTLASGISEFDQRQDPCVQAVFERADAAMHENKKRFKGTFRK
jgi:diguanylate cyclase (GGDEF)-like protein